MKIISHIIVFCFGLLVSSVVVWLFMNAIILVESPSVFVGVCAMFVGFFIVMCFVDYLVGYIDRSCKVDSKLK